MLNLCTTARLELSGGLEFSGCWQHYKGSHSIIRQLLSQKSQQGGELYSNVGWCQAVRLMNPSPQCCRTPSGTLVWSRGQGSSLPCTALEGHIQLQPPPLPYLFPCVLSSFFSSFPSSHPTFYFIAYYHQGLSCLICLFYFILIPTSISQPHHGQRF